MCVESLSVGVCCGMNEFDKTRAENYIVLSDISMKIELSVPRGQNHNVLTAQKNI